MQDPPLEDEMLSLVRELRGARLERRAAAGRATPVSAGRSSSRAVQQPLSTKCNTHATPNYHRPTTSSIARSSAWGTNSRPATAAATPAVAPTSGRPATATATPAARREQTGLSALAATRWLVGSQVTPEFFPSTAAAESDEDDGALLLACGSLLRAHRLPSEDEPGPPSGQTPWFGPPSVEATWLGDGGGSRVPTSYATPAANGRGAPPSHEAEHGPGRWPWAGLSTSDAGSGSALVSGSGSGATLPPAPAPSAGRTALLEARALRRHALGVARRRWREFCSRRRRVARLRHEVDVAWRRLCLRRGLADWQAVRRRQLREVRQALESEVQYRMGLMTHAGLGTSLLQCWKAGGMGAGQPPKLSAGFRRWRLWLAEVRRARAPAEEAARQLRARLQAARPLRH